MRSIECRTVFLRGFVARGCAVFVFLVPCCGAAHAQWVAMEQAKANVVYEIKLIEEVLSRCGQCSNREAIEAELEEKRELLRSMLNEEREWVRKLGLGDYGSSFQDIFIAIASGIGSGRSPVGSGTHKVMELYCEVQSRDNTEEILKDKRGFIERGLVSGMWTRRNPELQARMLCQAELEVTFCGVVECDANEALWYIRLEMQDACYNRVIEESPHGEFIKRRPPARWQPLHNRVLHINSCGPGETEHCLPGDYRDTVDEKRRMEKEINDDYKACLTAVDPLTEMCVYSLENAGELSTDYVECF